MSKKNQDQDIESLLKYCDADHAYVSFDNLLKTSRIGDETASARQPLAVSAVPASADRGSHIDDEATHGEALPPGIDPTSSKALRASPLAALSDGVSASTMDEIFRALSEPE